MQKVKERVVDMPMTAVERMAFMEELVPQFEQYVAEHERVKQETQPKAGIADYVTAGAGVALPLISRLFGKGSAGRDITRGLGAVSGGMFRGMQEGKRGIQASALEDVDRRQDATMTKFGMGLKLGEFEMDAGKQTALENYRTQQQEAQAARDAATTAHNERMYGISDRRETRMGEKFKYDQAQDAAAFDKQTTMDYGEYGAGPWIPGQEPYGPGADQRREAEAAYQRAATWLIQEMSRETGGNVEEREARLQQALTQLRQLYGLDLDPSMEIPAGGNRGIQTPAERMGMGGRPSLIDIDEELRRRGVNVGP